mmetsp:Transcript_13655/g.31040  ORF Transcript_13655/g.31040 Transcript_13655/m.31040 type:complete len:271 (-) Transcript_13655:872-1684(-)
MRDENEEDPTFVRFAVVGLDSATSRLTPLVEGVGAEPTLVEGFVAEANSDFRALTLACHFSLMFDTRSTMADSFGVPLHTECFSTAPIAFPIPDSLTVALVTGKSTILLSKCNKRSIPPTVPARAPSNQILTVVRYPSSTILFKTLLDEGVQPTKAKTKHLLCASTDARCWGSCTSSRPVVFESEVFVFWSSNSVYCREGFAVFGKSARAEAIFGPPPCHRQGSNRYPRFHRSRKTVEVVAHRDFNHWLGRVEIQEPSQATTRGIFPPAH